MHSHLFPSNITKTKGKNLLKGVPTEYGESEEKIAATNFFGDMPTKEKLNVTRTTVYLSSETMQAKSY